jgi:hypothetical protein
MPYVAHYVNIFGASQAAYELQAKDDEAAKAEGREYLRRHPSIEVWMVHGGLPGSPAMRRHAFGDTDYNLC